MGFPPQAAAFYGWAGTLMRKTLWIWFVGCAAWIFDGLISLRYHDPLHARLAFCVAMVFLVAGFFYRAQQR